MERTKRVMIPPSLLVLAACAEQDAAGFERAVDSFFVSILQFFLVMMLIAALFFVMWAMIFAGAATAVIAGIKRLRDSKAGGPPATPQPPQTSDAEQPAVSTAPVPPQPTTSSDPDWLGVGMIIFGVVLLLAAAPAVFTINLGPTSAGSTTIPMPLIVGGAALVWYALKRKKQMPAPRREDENRDADRGAR